MTAPSIFSIVFACGAWEGGFWQQYFLLGLVPEVLECFPLGLFVCSATVLAPSSDDETTFNIDTSLTALFSSQYS